MQNIEKILARKWPNVSIVGIKEKRSMEDWNKFLTLCYKLNDVTNLKKMLYGIQADMSDLRKDGIDSPEIVNLFLRLQASIEKTAQQLFRKIYPSNLDNPANDINIKKNLIRKAGGDTSNIDRVKKDFLKDRDIKIKRDKEFQKFLKESRF